MRRCEWEHYSGPEKMSIHAPCVGTRAVPPLCLFLANLSSVGPLSQALLKTLLTVCLTIPKSQSHFFEVQLLISTASLGVSGRQLGSGWQSSSYSHFLQLSHQESQCPLRHPSLLQGPSVPKTYTRLQCLPPFPLYSLLLLISPLSTPQMRWQGLFKLESCYIMLD